MSVQPLDRVTSLCSDMLFCKILSGAVYGVEANIYHPTSMADLELSSPQSLLLALLHSLVMGDTMSSIFLAEICHCFQQLRSRHLRVWLLEDFEFPRTDIENAISLLVQLVADGTLKLPTHVMTIMTSLAKKYRITTVQLRTLSEECRSSMAIQLENAVISNCPRDIFELESEGADVCGSTQSGDSLLHLAASTGSTSSIAALCILNVDPEVVNSSNITPLEEAVRYNCASSVKALLKAGAKLDKRLVGGDTYLHIAAAGGHNQALEALLEGGIDVNEQNQLGQTPLAQAVRAGNVCSIELLQEKGADFSALSGVRLSNGDSIVHSVARSGNIEVLKLLKDKKIPANIENQDGLTPLHVACDSSVVRILLRMGVEVDAQDNTGSTPLMIAARNNKADIVNLLLVGKANPLIKDNKGRTALHYAAEGGCTDSVTTLLLADARVNKQDNEGNTPAFVAALNNRPAVLKLLVEHEADLELKESNSDRLIHHEARSGHVELVKALLKAGLSVNMVGKDQRTALHYAAQEGHTDMVRALLKTGAEADLVDEDQWTALHYAAQRGHTDVVKALLDPRAALEMKNKNQKTALHLAAREDHNVVTTELLDHEADLALKTGLTPLIAASCEAHLAVVDRSVDVNARTNQGHTALHLAASGGYTAVVRALLEARAAADMQDKKQTTALHLAACRGHTAVATMLLDHGADLTLKAVNDWTPLIVASSCGHLAVVQLLVDNGAKVNARTSEGHTALWWANRISHTAIADYLRSRGGVG